MNAAAERLLLVEGESDRVALEATAAVLGVDLAATGVVIRPMGGITNLGHHLPRTDPAARVALLHDIGEASYVRRTVARFPDRALPCFACDRDLEDELVRAHGGVRGALAVVEAAGDLPKWEILTGQPFHRERDEVDVLRRFWGTTSGRKERYALLLVEGLAPARVPAVLRDALATVTG
ncbi:TOPRIM nucleotidyl transferase/hydrolase domain-containing protein [Nocardioides caeni]|uniref:ATP-dependent endonuclease n=1 Tax=Nocardioides caeni TaxID=574700 RepID=A0A4S8N3G1_9ACTN|nr:TOPRIM nucleotidyl transferase/hydrolase domain-containing protein [Nocardioides caeni]THV10071.1 ATP-dependent endonuclease [Nocardioides caeni]